jgi:DNA-binding beta-propeller fold protein YncE
VTRGSGVIDAAGVADVLVSCDARIQSVTGTVQGLTGTGIVLRNNGADDLVIAADGGFTFATTMAPGDEYLVTVEQQPADSGRHCSVSNGVGIVGPVGVSDIRVQCRSVGRWIYVSTTETIPGGDPYGTFMFSWDPATDQFQLLAGSPISRAVRAAVAPDGTFAYVHLWKYFAADNRLAAYVIDQSTGALVQVPGAAPLPLDATLADAAIDPSSRYLYYVQYWDDRVFAYAVNATGSITAVPGGRAGDFRDLGGKLAFDPQGRFLFVANRANGTISAFGIDADSGALIEFSGSPYSLAFAPEDLDVEPQGRYLYVTSSSKQLVPYVIDGFDGSTGALRPASVAPFTPTRSTGGSYGFDPNSNRISYIAWCSWSSGECPYAFEVSWGLWHLAVDETGAVHPLGDAEFLTGASQFTAYDTPQFDSSGKFVCFLSTTLQQGGSLGCRLVDATTGALGEGILHWSSLEQSSTVTSFVIAH